MKKLLTVILCVAFLCMGMVVTTAAEEAETPKLPWIDEGVKVEIVMDFNENADGTLDASSPGIWSGNNWPVTSEWRDGQMVYTEVMMDTFWFQYATQQLTDKAAAGNTKKAEGFGVYIKNGTEWDFSYGPYVIGSFHWKMYNDKPVYLYSIDGTVTRAEVLNDTTNMAVTIPGGFEGYVVIPATSFGTDQKGVDEDGNYFSYVVGEDGVNAWGMIFNGLGMFVDAGNEVIVDNVFIYGTEVADEPGTLTYTVTDIDISAPGTEDAPTEEAPTPTEEAPTPTEEAPTPTEEAPTPTEEAPTPTEEAPTPTEEAPTPTEEAPAENDEEAGFPWLIVVIAVVAVAVIAAVVVIVIKKKGAQKDAE